MKYHIRIDVSYYLVHTGKTLESWIFDYSESNPVLAAELLQLRHDAVGDVGDTLGVQTVHHALDDVHLVLDGEVDEVGVHEDVKGRPELSVILEEESAGLLDVFGGLDLVGILGLLLPRGGPILVLQSRV